MVKMFKTWLVVVAALWSVHAVAAGMDVTVEHPWVREAPPTAAALGGFMVLKNNTDKPLVLVGASSPDTAEVMLHRSIMEGGMMKMVHQKSIEIPAKGQLEFKPGDYHLMLMKPKKAFKAGDKIEITLKFEDGSTLPATFEVRAGMGGGMKHGSDMGNMKHGM